jgi:plastocyanin
MRKIFLLAAAVSALSGVPAGSAANATVTITRAGFVPADVTIRVGDSVTWTNTDTVVHQVVVEKYPCSLTLQTTQSGSCTFTRAGKFNYRDPSQRGSFRGTIEVTAGAASTTIAASRTIVVYGGAATLSGQLSTNQGGEAVSIWAQPFGQSAFQKVTETTTAADGKWAAAVRPTIQTVYQARVRNATSPNVTVKVRPRVTLGYGAVTRLFTTRVIAAQSFAGKVVFFQRRSSLGQWVTLKKATLNSASAASFRVRLPKGRSTVRALLPASQTLPGYLAGFSPARIVTR